jgi:transposase-like protein
MYIVTPTASDLPIPSACFSCGSRFHKNGSRQRHVIEHVKKVWHTLQRFRCSACGQSFTLLKTNMLPRKHYAAQEIEEVLRKHEDPSAPTPCCGAEESTLNRWKREFPKIIVDLTMRLHSLINAPISLISRKRPLQRLYEVVKALPHLSPEGSYLAWAYYVSKTHPVRVE